MAGAEWCWRGAVIGRLGRSRFKNLCRPFGTCSAIRFSPALPCRAFPCRPFGAGSCWPLSQRFWSEQEQPNVKNGAGVACGSHPSQNRRKGGAALSEVRLTSKSTTKSEEGAVDVKSNGKGGGRGRPFYMGVINLLGGLSWG